jgi:hypothetical protein
MAGRRSVLPIVSLKWFEEELFTVYQQKKTEPTEKNIIPFLCRALAW